MTRLFGLATVPWLVTLLPASWLNWRLDRGKYRWRKAVQLGISLGCAFFFFQPFMDLILVVANPVNASRILLRDSYPHPHPLLALGALILSGIGSGVVVWNLFGLAFRRMKHLRFAKYAVFVAAGSATLEAIVWATSDRGTVMQAIPSVFLFWAIALALAVWYASAGTREMFESAERARTACEVLATPGLPSQSAILEPHGSEEEQGNTTDGWKTFLIAVAVRLIAGAALGCGASLLFSLRLTLSIAASDAPVLLRLAIWGGIGAVVCVCTTPRHSWPWRRDDNERAR